MASQDWLKNFPVDSGKMDEWDSRTEVFQSSSSEDYQGQSYVFMTVFHGYLTWTFCVFLEPEKVEED